MAEKLKGKAPSVVNELNTEIQSEGFHLYLKIGYKSVIMKLKVLESTQPIVEESKYVWINRNKISEFCSKIKQIDFRIELGIPSNWPLEKYSELILLFNTINFSYWAPKGKEKWQIQINGKVLDGAMGVFAALEKTIKEGYELLDGETLANLSRSDLEYILRGNVTIPMLEERLSCLNEAGRVLKKKFKGRYSNLIKKAVKSAVNLVRLLVNNFPSFNDFVWYNGQKTEFHKRAQLSAKMIHDALIARGKEGFSDLGELTVFADYKLPQVLRDKGILVYSKDLANKIDNLVEIPAGSREEIEIRANTIWACEFIKRALRLKFPSVTAPHVDSLLWLASQEKSSTIKPYHRTRTIFY